VTAASQLPDLHETDAGPHAGADSSAELARRLHALVAEHPDFEVLDPPGGEPYCFRYLPDAVSARRAEPPVAAWLDRLNHDIGAALERCRLPVVTTPRIDGRVVLRLAGRAVHALALEIEAVFDAIAHLGRCYSRPLPDFAVGGDATA
jgi:glutamate/tyrosine decarboxylase-like PLP-dependent enzyme